MKAGTIRRRAPTPRLIGFNVGFHLGPRRRAAVRRALDHQIIYVWQPGYRRTAENRYRFDPRQLDGLTAGAGRLEARAFLWLGFCRYRLIQTLAELKDRPLGHGLASRIADWSLATDTIRNALFTCNFRLSHKAVKAAYRGWADLEDAKQEALLDLARAVDYFNVARGTKFATYAYLAIIRKAVGRMVKERRRAIREGWSYSADVIPQYAVAQPRSIQWVAERMDVLQLLKDNRLGLTLREAEVLRRHYGFNGSPAETLVAIGLSWNRSRQTACNAHDTALAKFRAGLWGPTLLVV